MADSGCGGEGGWRRERARGVKFNVGEGGRRGWVSVVAEGSRDAVIKDWAAAREVGEGGRSMSDFEKRGG